LGLTVEEQQMQLHASALAFKEEQVAFNEQQMRLEIAEQRQAELNDTVQELKEQLARVLAHQYEQRLSAPNFPAPHSPAHSPVPPLHLTHNRPDPTEVNLQPERLLPGPKTWVWNSLAKWPHRCSTPRPGTPRSSSRPLSAR